MALIVRLSLAASDYAELRPVLLRLEDRRLPLPGQVLKAAGLEQRLVELSTLTVVHVHERPGSRRTSSTRRLRSALAIGRAYGEGDTWRAMSQENVELARQSLDAFNRRDWAAALALWDEDAEIVAGGVVMEGDYHGHAGIRRFWENIFAAIPDFSVKVVEMRDLGDLTLGAARVRGHGAGSDTPFDEMTWGVAEWRDGKCVRWGSYATEAEALEAVGLRG